MTGYDAGDYDFHDPTRMPDGSIDLILHIVPREEWGAEKYTSRRKPHHPFKLVIDHFTYTDPCLTQKQCIKAVKEIQKQHMQQGHADIQYNFLIGGDGCIYEGRGWHNCPSKALKKVKGYLRRRIDIAYIGDFTGTKTLVKRRLDIGFIGDYTDKNIPDPMVLRRMDVIDFGVKFGMIKRLYNFLSIRKEDYDLPEVDYYNNNIMKSRMKKVEGYVYQPKDDNDVEDSDAYIPSDVPESDDTVVDKK